MVDSERAGNTRRDPGANRDPLTGEAGSHPLGTGVGSAGGAAAGETGREESSARRVEVRRGLEFDDSEPAYRYGWESANLPEYRGRRFDEAESDLERGWTAQDGASCEWPAARDAARRAWERVRREESAPPRQGGEE